MMCYPFCCIFVFNIVLFCDIISNIWANTGGKNMRIKKGFVLREVAGQIMVIATGEASKDFHGMIKLNASGKVIWLGLQEGLSQEQIAVRLQEQFDVDSEKALEDTQAFIKQMEEMEFLVNE